MGRNFSSASGLLALAALCLPQAALAGGSALVTYPADDEEHEMVVKLLDPGSSTGSAPAFSFWAYEKQPTLAAGAVVVDPQTCQILDQGSFTVPQKPKRGVVTVAVEERVVPSVAEAGPCGGRTVSFNVVRYTWTADAATTPSCDDAFTLSWQSSALRGTQSWQPTAKFGPRIMFKTTGDWQDITSCNEHLPATGMVKLKPPR